MECSNELSPRVTHQPSLLGGAENMKLLFDTTMAIVQQIVTDNQANARAWNALNLETASRRSANNGAYDHAVSMGSVLAAQAGVTESQQTVSPIRTGAADNLAAGGAPANRITDTTGAVAGGTIETASAAVAAAIAKSVNDTITLELSALQQTIQAIADSQAAIAAALTALKPAA